MTRKYYIGGALLLLIGAFLIIGSRVDRAGDVVLTPPQEAISDPYEDGNNSELKLAAPSSGRQNALDSSGAYTLSQRVVVPSGGAVTAVERLRPLAMAGDSEAALAIYLKIRECDKLLSQELSGEHVEMYERAGAGPSLLEGIAVALENCEGVDKVSEESSQWLIQAARAGVEEAQLLYATNPAPVLGGQREMLQDPQAIDHYKSMSMHYLTSLAAKGNVEAMLALARTYDAGVLTERDSIRSYAYYKAVSLAVPGILPREFIDSIQNRLPLDQRSEADRLGAVIHRQCCIP